MARTLADEGLNRILERLAVDLEQSSIVIIHSFASIHSLVSTAHYPVVTGIINVIICSFKPSALPWRKSWA
ncbi:MAG: hypothetical protein EBU46_10715 [Nitrosomonadaceae bacterium]|nr:hypothetical protein [Nitrosomonadaceae bacterium]